MRPFFLMAILLNFAVANVSYSAACWIQAHYGLAEPYKRALLAVLSQIKTGIRFGENPRIYGTNYPRTMDYLLSHLDAAKALMVEGNYKILSDIYVRVRKQIFFEEINVADAVSKLQLNKRQPEFIQLTEALNSEDAEEVARARQQVNLLGTEFVQVFTPFQAGIKKYLSDESIDERIEMILTAMLKEKKLLSQ